MTPLGTDVDPEVYWRNARLALPMAGGTQSADGLGPIESMGCRRRIAWELPTVFANIAVVSATFAPASRAIDSIRSFNRCDFGRPEGTAILPAYRHPKKAARNSSPWGKSRRTGSLGLVMPCRYSATARARSSNSP